MPGGPNRKRDRDRRYQQSAKGKAGDQRRLRREADEPNARFHFNSGPLDQRGTFKGIWLSKDEWALQKLAVSEH
jgi:hypothetical protein